MEKILNFNVAEFSKGVFSYPARTPEEIEIMEYFKRVV